MVEESGKNGRVRNDTGTYAEQYPDDAFIKALRNAGDWVSSEEVSSIIGCSRETARRKLMALKEREETDTDVTVEHKVFGNTNTWKITEEVE